MNNGQYSDATGDQCSHEFAYVAKPIQVVKMGVVKPEFAALLPYYQKHPLRRHPQWPIGKLRAGFRSVADKLSAT